MNQCLSIMTISMNSQYEPFPDISLKDTAKNSKFNTHFALEIIETSFTYFVDLIFYLYHYLIKWCLITFTLYIFPIKKLT